jgi:hypothetical protein
MFFVLVELILILGIAWFAITQIIVPSLKGRPWFPFFKKETKLKGELAELEQEEYEAKLAKEVEAKKQNLNNITSESEG